MRLEKNIAFNMDISIPVLIPVLGALNLYNPFALSARESG